MDHLSLTVPMHGLHETEELQPDLPPLLKEWITSIISSKSLQLKISGTPGFSRLQTLGNLMEISLRAVLDLARLEAQGRNTRFGLEATEHYIRAELGDPDLQAGLQAIFRTFQGLGTDHTTVEGQLITRIFHRLRCVLLCLSILESPTVQFGVMTQKAQYLGKIVISFCQKQAIGRGGPIEDYYLISWHNFT